MGSKTNKPKVTRIQKTNQPAIFAREALAVSKHARLGLGLDFGTTCGVALAYFATEPEARFGPEIFLGTWDLSAGPYDSGAIRFVRLRQFLEMVKPDCVFYESPKYVPPREVMAGRNLNAICARIVPSAEFLGALMATTCTWAEEHGVPAQGYAVAQLKKFATGKGQCDKSKMLQACNEQLGTCFDTEKWADGEDNEADAAFALLHGMYEYGLGLSSLLPYDMDAETTTPGA